MRRLLVLFLAALLSHVMASAHAPACAGSEEVSGVCGFPSEQESAVAPPPAAPVPSDKGAGLVLYGNPVSTCTRRVLLALLEKGLTDFKLVLINLQKGELKIAEFMEMQPFGQIPVLTDGDLTLFESRAIARYIAEKYADQGIPLLGSTPQERAIVNVWYESESQEFNPHAAVIAFEMVIGPRYGRTPNKEKAQEAADKLSKVFDVYNARLEKNEFFGGSSISLADLSHIPYMAHLWPAGYSHLVEDRPHVKRWWESVTSRPSWKTILDGLPEKLTS